MQPDAILIFFFGLRKKATIVPEMEMDVARGIASLGKVRCDGHPARRDVPLFILRPVYALFYCRRDKMAEYYVLAVSRYAVVRSFFLFPFSPYPEPNGSACLTESSFC
jgi:hypothetical protein